MLSLLYVTCPTLEEGRHIVTILLSERLIVCANIIPTVFSLYQWEGTIQEGKEAVLLIKTAVDLVASVRSRIKALHSYTCPLILVIAVDATNPAIDAWLKESIHKEHTTVDET
ncbi:MAG: divalent-cation tolerance protein CutA [Candidatus Cardinium sp.]|nr:divalent-cation tolerance protein CutA [Candidatus Cardinium sp.]